MKIIGKEFTFNGNKVYHAGSKPTVSEIGAAASSHTHNYAGSSSAGGNANAAIKLATARTINGTSFNGSANITTANWGTARTLTIGNTGKSVNGSGNVSWSLSEIGAAAASHTHAYAPTSTGSSISIHADSDSSSTSEYLLLKAGHNELKIASSAGGTTVTKGQDKLTFNGNVVYHTGKKPTPADIGAAASSHTHNYAGSSSAGGAANSANTLATARTINGTSFNGSANITTANWGTARTLTIGNTGKSVNGSGNVSWSLSEIGAAPASHTHSYLPLSGGVINGSITVNTDVNVGNTVLCKDVVIRNNQVIYGRAPESESVYALIGTTGDTITIGYNNQTPIFMCNNTFFNTGLTSEQYATFRQGSLSNRAVCIETWGDGNNQGDGNSYLGLNDKGYHHYFRGKGATYVHTLGGMHVSHGIQSLSDVSVYGNVNTRTGVTYSSSMHEKANITPLNEDAITLNNKSINYNSIIKNGIKNAKLHLYNYKKTELLDEKNISIKEIDSKNLEDNDVYIGFLGQELENENPDFFNLIGSSYTEEDGTVQYKIREASIIGALWAGLQSAFKEIDSLKSQIEK